MISTVGNLKIENLPKKGLFYGVFIGITNISVQCVIRVFISTVCITDACHECRMPQASGVFVSLKKFIGLKSYLACVRHIETIELRAQNETIINDLKHWNLIVWEIVNTEHTLHVVGLWVFCAKHYVCRLLFYSSFHIREKWTFSSCVDQAIDRVVGKITIILWFDSDFHKIEQIEWQWFIWNIIRKSLSSSYDPMLRLWTRHVKKCEQWQNNHIKQHSSKISK